MCLIDFHTHILPGVDDGSRSIEESVVMLEKISAQGVKTVIATPHFYANDESVDAFLERRNKAFELLNDKIPNDVNIVLGAEVRYYDGISHLQELKQLRIEGTRLLLLEMPFNRWTDYAVKEIIDIASRGKITLVLAHIERYLPLIDMKTIKTLHANGVLFQVNASFFKGFVKSSKAIKMLSDEMIQFIGSDCHNTADRSPNVEIAQNAIIKKIGKNAFEEFSTYTNSIFSQNKV